MPNSACALALAERRLAARAPAGREGDGARRLLASRRPGDAFVELHDDVGPKLVGLDFDGALGGEPMARAVDVALEGDALLAQAADLGERHHLEAAGVGEDRPVPAHEAVQSAEPRHPFGARPQHQVIGVAEDDLGAGLAHLIAGQRLDRAGGADRHEGGRLDHAARGDQAAGPRRAVAGVDFEGKRGHQSRRHSRQASP